jgi:hypothetical protein
VPSGHRLTGRSLAAAMVGLLALGTTTAAAAADDVRPEPGRPWFGPVLDWTRDLPADYADRLGETPSLYGQSVHYPLTDDDRDYLAQFAELVATQGAVAALTLEPQVSLRDLGVADAELLADDLAGLHDRLGTHFLVRFAPEMNGSWVAWGQQPEAYVAAFRRVADAVHDSPAADAADLVWAPAYGAGYPFGGSYGAVEPAGRRARIALDTNEDGVVDDGDDPYGPYYPGAAAVDWVGLSLYHFGKAQDFGDNELPADGELAARLEDRFGYGVRAPRRSFYDRWVRPDRPLLLETAALYDTANPDGVPEQELKRAWWRQVLAVVDDHPAIGAISWLEVQREEAEIDGNLADWRATHTPELALDLRDQLARSPVRLGPVTRATDVDAVEPRDDDDRAGNASPAWWAAGAVVLGAAWLGLRLVRRRRTA